MTFDAAAADSVIAAASGRNSSPATSGDAPRTACRYSEDRKIAPTTTPVTPAITAEAETSDRIRQVAGGTSGVGGAALQPGEGGQQHRGGGQREPGAGRGPPGRAGGLDAEHQRQQPADQGERAGQRPGGAARAAAGCRGRRPRSVPTTTAMPIGTLMKNTARQPRALVSAPPNSTPAAMPRLPIGAPDGQCGLPLLAGVGGHDDRQRGRGEQRGAGALRGAGQDQHQRALGQPAGQRGGGEQADAGEEGAAPVEQVGDPAAEQQQPAGEQHVGADRPLVVRGATGAGRG